MTTESSMEEDADSKITHGPYQRYITSLLGTHPHLQVLDRFIDEHDWDRWRRAGHPKPEGLTKFNVVVVDIELRGKCPDHEAMAYLRTSEVQKSATALEMFLRLNPLEPRESLRLYLVEDLSRDVVEYFGSRFSLDPNFFEGHVRDHERLLSGRPLLEYLFAVHPSPPTVSEACGAGYYTASFFRPYKFAEGGDTAWKDAQRIRWQNENVIRHGVAYLKLQTTDAFFLTERFSVATVPKERLDTDDPPTVIILFDPFLPLRPPSMMCGYRNGIPPPEFDRLSSYTNTKCGPGTHRALRGDFLDWLRSLEGKALAERVRRFTSGEEFLLVDHLFRVAAANTQSNIRELQDAIEHIENKMRGFWRFKGYDMDEETAADCIQMLRYFVMDIMRAIEETTSLLRGRFCDVENDEGGSCPSYLQANSGIPRSPLRDLRTDFGDLSAKLRGLCSRTETDIDYFIARLSAKEAQRAQVQADELKWMNYAVFMLGPVSTLAAILALQERDRNVVMFLICACAAGLVILLLRFWKSVPRIGRKLILKVQKATRVNGGRISKDDVSHVGEEPLFDYLGKDSTGAGK